MNSFLYWSSGSFVWDPRPFISKYLVNPKYSAKKCARIEKLIFEDGLRRGLIKQSRKRSWVRIFSHQNKSTHSRRSKWVEQLIWFLVEVLLGPLNKNGRKLMVKEHFWIFSKNYEEVCLEHQRIWFPIPFLDVLLVVSPCEHKLQTSVLPPITEYRSNELASVMASLSMTLTIRHSKLFESFWSLRSPLPKPRSVGKRTSYFWSVRISLPNEIFEGNFMKPSSKKLWKASWALEGLPSGTFQRGKPNPWKQAFRLNPVFTPIQKVRVRLITYSLKSEFGLVNSWGSGQALWRKPSCCMPSSHSRFLGLDNAGKTTILRSMCSESIESTAPTRGFNAKQLRTGNLEFTIWDIGGQKALRAYWTNYYDQVNGIVWVIDSADLARLTETGFELAALLEEERLAGLPLLVLANKQDLATAETPDSVLIFSYSRLQQLLGFIQCETGIGRSKEPLQSTRPVSKMPSFGWGRMSNKLSNISPHLFYSYAVQNQQPLFHSSNTIHLRNCRIFGAFKR